MINLDKWSGKGSHVGCGDIFRDKIDVCSGGNMASTLDL